MTEREMKGKGTRKGTWCSIRKAKRFKLFTDFDCWF